MKLASLLCFRSQAEVAANSMGMPKTPPSVACQYCGSVFRPGNHTTRLQPKMKINKKVRKLMARQQNGSTLGRFQQKVVTMYISSKNKVVKTCLVCNMSSIIDCKTRSTKIRSARSSRAPSRVPSHLSLSSIPTSDSSTSSGPSMRQLSKKQLRRLQQQQQQQQQQPLNDSGLDVSISSSFLSTSASSRSLSASSVDSAAPQFTSTPILNPSRVRTRNFSSESFSHTVVAAAAPALRLGALNLAAKSTQDKKKGKKSNKKGILQKMLAQEKKEKIGPHHSSTLAAFLSSLQ